VVKVLDFNRKEELVGIKLKVLQILNMILEDELYKKDMLVKDLTNLIAHLDYLEDRVQSVDDEIS
jgi:hypothetical protein